jgi:acyl-CoA synthetase (NDP forming)
VREELATTAEQVGTAALAMGDRVVLKVVSDAIAHKSDLGLVRVGVAASDAARVADELLGRAAQLAADAAVTGVVVQECVEDAVAEVILGVSRQHPFGPSITYGLGGVFTEIFADVSFGVPPFDEQWARRMVLGTKSAPLLTGARGREHGDVDALVETIMALQHFVTECGDRVAELDLNPVLVRPRGRGVVAVDALLIVAD